MNYPKTEMKLTSSVSEQNVFLTYVCTINDVNPRNGKLNTDSKTNYNLFEDRDAQDVTEDEHIKVERSKALHELVDAHADEHVVITNNVDGTTTYGATSDYDATDYEDAKHKGRINPNILKLTKMKWLTEEKDDSLDSRSPSLSLSPVSSTTSSEGRESETNLNQRMSFGDKYLSTILRLDKEHNLFGLSNIAIVGSRTSKKACKKDEKPAFPQTAIVQVCCRKKCCKYKSNTDLPAVLKCSSCRFSSCCPEYSVCSTYPVPEMCPATSCTRGCRCSCSVPCKPKKCRYDCSNSFGLTLTLKMKPKYEPTYAEITPRSSCIQSKPMSCRRCTHLPRCLPPSAGFPYLMPCYWPARAMAPCPAATRCFHNPPCPPARKTHVPVPDCARPKCDPNNKTPCKAPTCPGNVEEFRKALVSKFGVKEANDSTTEGGASKASQKKESQTSVKSTTGTEKTK